VAGECTADGDAEPEVAAVADDAATNPESESMEEEASEPVAQEDDDDDEEDSATTTPTNEPDDPKCPDRDHLIRCAAKYLDQNGNGMLDRNELDDAVASLPWYARGLLNILGSVDKMMKKCDVDGDGAIGFGSAEADMENNKETCLATCFKRRAFKGAFFPECDL